MAGGAELDQLAHELERDGAGSVAAEPAEQVDALGLQKGGEPAH